MKWMMMLIVMLSATFAIAREDLRLTTRKLHIPVSRSAGGPEEQAWISRLSMGSVQSRALGALVDQARKDLSRINGFTSVASPQATKPIYDRLHDQIRELLSDDQWGQLVLAVKHRPGRIRPLVPIS